MTLHDLPFEQRIQFIRAMLDAVKQWRSEADSFLNGAKESWEYQPDIHWYEAYGMKQSLVILYGEEACSGLSLFLSNFTAVIDNPDDYEVDEDLLLQNLLDAFGIAEEEYNACGY